MPHPVALAPMADQLHAWVLDLPGCIAGGRDAAELAERIPLAIAEYLAWLEEHGERVPSSIAWEVVETVDPRHVRDTNGNLSLNADSEPLSDAELEIAIARLAYARADLLASVGRLPDTVLDWTPPRASVDRFDAWAPDVRGMRAIVAHVLSFELYYRDGLRDGPASGIFEPAADAERERAQTAAILRSLPVDERTRVFHPLRPGQPAPEQWTVRKVLRRLIAHERVHTAELRLRRAWLLLGAPGRIDPVQPDV